MGFIFGLSEGLLQQYFTIAITIASPYATAEYRQKMLAEKTNCHNVN